jgi:hypothetical protein
MFIFLARTPETWLRVCVLRFFALDRGAMRRKRLAGSNDQKV